MNKAVRSEAAAASVLMLEKHLFRVISFESYTASNLNLLVSIPVVSWFFCCCYCFCACVSTRTVLELQSMVSVLELQSMVSVLELQSGTLIYGLCSIVLVGYILKVL